MQYILKTMAAFALYIDILRLPSIMCSSRAKSRSHSTLLAAAQDDSGISTFEFLNSGTVSRLKSHLTGMRSTISCCVCMFLHIN